MVRPVESSIKGSVVHEFLLWAERRPGGTELMTRIGASLTPDERSLVDPNAPGLGMLSSVWYPSSLVHRVLDGVGAGLSREEQRAVAREACRVVVPKLVRGIYRVMFDSIAVPSLYARFVPRLWSQLHSTGRREMTVQGNSASSVVSAWAGHHPMLCDVVIETMGELFHLMLRSPIVVERVTCVAEGAADCRTVMRW